MPDNDYHNELQDKSDLNLDSSSLLYKNSLYDSVCHPAYYSCLQFMSHKLIIKGIKLDDQASITSRDYNGNSHKYLIESTRRYIKFESYNDEREYKRYIGQLKEFRERSDYKSVRITPEESEKCIYMAKTIRQYLKSI